MAFSLVTWWSSFMWLTMYFFEENILLQSVHCQAACPADSLFAAPGFTVSRILTVSAGTWSDGVGPKNKRGAITHVNQVVGSSVVFWKYWVEGVSPLVLVVSAHMDSQRVSWRKHFLAEGARVSYGGVFVVLWLKVAKHLVPAWSSELAQGTGENLPFRVAHNVRNNLLFPCSDQVCNRIAWKNCILIFAMIATTRFISPQNMKQLFASFPTVTECHINGSCQLDSAECMRIKSHLH